MTTGLDTFDRTVQESNLWLKDVMERLNTHDRHHAYSTLRAVLHALPHVRVTRLAYTETGQSIELQAKPQGGISMSTIGEKLHGVPGVIGIDISH